MVVGAAGVSLIQESEGVRTKAYRDPVGIPTICYGHTGKDVRMGLRYTLKQCDEILMVDLRNHRAGLNKCVTAKLNQNQSDALLSLAFNVGVSATCKSTLVRKANAGDLLGASREFPRWAYAGRAGSRVRLPGLVTRRERERVLWLSPAPPQPPSQVFLELTK